MGDFEGDKRGNITEGKVSNLDRSRKAAGKYEAKKFIFIIKV